jgi:hypothetical protein
LQEAEEERTRLLSEAEEVVQQIKQEAEAERTRLITEAQQVKEEAKAESADLLTGAQRVKEEAEAESTKLLTEAQRVKQEAEEVAQQVNWEAEAERARLLAEAQEGGSELIAQAETLAAAVRQEAAETAHKARELVAESKRTIADMRRQAEELFEMTEWNAEQVSAITQDLALHAEAQPDAIEQEEAAPILYEGRVLLVVPAGTSELELERWQDQLRNFPEIRIVNQWATIAGDTTLLLSVDKPFQLVQRLMDIPNVESAKDTTPDWARRPRGTPSSLGHKPQPQASALVIQVHLKSDGGNHSSQEVQDQES